MVVVVFCTALIITAIKPRITWLSASVIPVSCGLFMHFGLMGLFFVAPFSSGLLGFFIF